MTVEIIQEQEEVSVEDVANATIAEDTKSDGEGVLLEEEQSEESVSVDEIINPKTDIQKSKEGTPPNVQKRIDTLVRERNQARQELKKERAEKHISSKPMVPVPADFESTEAYQEAFSKFSQDSQTYNDATKVLEEVGEEESTVISENNSRYVKGVADLKASFPNAEDVIAKTPFNEIQGVVAGVDNSAKVALYYALNPKVLEKVKKLSENKRVEEVLKMDLKFNESKKAQTKAPPPITPVNGEATSTPKNIYEIKNGSEWLKARNKQVRGQ